MSDVAIVKCSRASSSDHSHTTVLNSDRKFSGWIFPSISNAVFMFVEMPEWGLLI